MATMSTNRNQRNDQNNDDQNKAAKTPSRESVEKTEQDPAVERGERINSGKQIARSGKEQGKVPGAEKS